jgi:hypothetical protein
MGHVAFLYNERYHKSNSRLFLPVGYFQMQSKNRASSQARKRDL